MAHAAYDGIFLAPESIVMFPGFTSSDLNRSLQQEPSGARTERSPETMQRPGQASEQ